MIAKTASPAPAEPLVVLGGGPGFRLLDAVSQLSRDPSLRLAVARRDWIFVEQRGVGWSSPVLDCPFAPGGDRMTRRDAARCVADLRSRGVDLAGYSTMELAADVVDLRRALGVARWNVYGFSFGTGWAMEVARADPAGVRSLVLDSPYPAHRGQFGLDAPAGYAAAVQRLLLHCDRDEPCRRAYPALRANLDGALNQLRASPVTVSGGRLDDVAFADLLRVMQRDAGLIGDIPATIEAAWRRDAKVLADAVAAAGLDGFISSPDNTAMGMYLANACRIRPSAAEVAALQRLAGGGGLAARFAESELHLAGLCDVLPPVATDPTERIPVLSDTPALVLVGDVDTSSPPGRAYDAARTLSNATVLVFPWVGHNLLATGGVCPVSLILRFLDTLDGEHLDRTCMASYRPPTWRR